MAIKYTNGSKIVPPKFTQSGIFGLKIYKLATLLSTPFRDCHARLSDKMASGRDLGFAKNSRKQSCQIFFGTLNQIWEKIPN
jgi:hypothetical protein